MVTTEAQPFGTMLCVVISVRKMSPSNSNFCEVRSIRCLCVTRGYADRVVRSGANVDYLRQALVRGGERICFFRFSGKLWLVRFPSVLSA
jgi:hypothetical protein